MLYTTIDSPIGELLLAGDGTALQRLDMREGRRPVGIGADWRRSDAAFVPVIGQLERYFAGELRDFDVPLSLHGNPFELRVWNALLEIPYGETVSYGEIARQIGEPGAPRAGRGNSGSSNNGSTSGAGSARAIPAGGRGGS